MHLRSWITALVTVGALAAVPVTPATATPPAAPGETGRLTPPMGWNSWNSGIPLTENTIHEVIDSMVDSGMRDAGYRYVNLDAGWAAPRRDGAGNLYADPERFPHGMAALADYAHERGMYLGLYSSPFNLTCGQTPENASLGHEAADARTFADWGVDLLKYDWCRSDGTLDDEVRAFTAMGDALRGSGRRILYSINPNSSDANPSAAHDYDWSTVADMTRNSGDLIPMWDKTAPDRIGDLSTGNFLGVTDQLDEARPLAARSRAGYWNDPDMLVVGVQLAEFLGTHLGGIPGMALKGVLPQEDLRRFGSTLQLPPDIATLLRTPRISLTADEERAHFSLWAMLAAPLLAGNDVRTMSEQTRAVLTNPEVVAVDQDPLVAQATALPNDGRVLVKPLADGSSAVALYNPGTRPETIETTAAAVGLPSAASYTVRDLWAHGTATTAGGLRAEVPAHGVTMLRVTPAG